MLGGCYVGATAVAVDPSEQIVVIEHPLSELIEVVRTRLLSRLVVHDQWVTTREHGVLPDTDTRAGWQSIADDLLAAAHRYASPQQALLVLPGPSSASGSWSDGLEGYARTFLLAAFRVGGAHGADPHGLVERYAQGLRAGTDPTGSERWPRVAERRQVVVEAASVAIGLSETRTWLWDALDDGTKQRAIDWLAGVVGTSGYSNNWIWFQNVIEAFLAEVGGPWQQSDLDRNEEIQERLYVGDGWYSDGWAPDGARQNFDYYAGWAWHIYPLLQARIRGRELESRHRERLAAFLAQARYLTGSSGAPVLQGRSLTYRFATVAPFWAGALAGVSPFPAGGTRRLASGVLRNFIDRGSINDRGLLPIGWYGEFPRIRQLYTGGSSPYWASKGFLGLLLPADHPEWTAPARKQPTERLGAADSEPRYSDAKVGRPSQQSVDGLLFEPGARALAAPGWLVSHSEDGIVRLINHGSDGWRGAGAGTPRADDPFYARLGYSNVTSPELGPAAVRNPLESHIALVAADATASHRGVIERRHFGETVAVSRSRVQWLDLEQGDHAGWAALRRGPFVTTASVLRGVNEVRLAWWTAVVAREEARLALDTDAAWPSDPGPWRFRFGGWALPGAGVVQRVGHGVATATATDGTTTAIHGLRGLGLFGVRRRDGGTPLADSSLTPWAESQRAVGQGEVVAALITLAGEPIDTDTSPVQELQILSDEIRVLWTDGAVDIVPAFGEVRS